MRRTYAGAARHLNRALTVAFYRAAGGLGIPYTNARAGVERADRFLQRLGLIYLLVGVPVAVLILLVNR